VLLLLPPSHQVDNNSRGSYNFTFHKNFDTNPRTTKHNEARYPYLFALSLAWNAHATRASRVTSTMEGFSSDDPPRSYSKPAMSLTQFQELLFTEIHDEVHAIERSANDINRRIQEGADLWEDIIQHGWSSAESKNTSRNLQGTNKENHQSPSATFPFLICSRSTQRASGAQYLKPMLNNSGARMNDVIVVYNDHRQTCTISLLPTTKLQS